MSQNLTLLSHIDLLSFSFCKMLMPQTGRGKVGVGREGGGEGWAYLGESILVYFGGKNRSLITFFLKSTSREI